MWEGGALTRMLGRRLRNAMNRKLNLNLCRARRLEPAHADSFAQVRHPRRAAPTPAAARVALATLLCFRAVRFCSRCPAAPAPAPRPCPFARRSLSLPKMAQEQVDPAKLAQMIEYSEKYQDDQFEYRCVGAAGGAGPACARRAVRVPRPRAPSPYPAQTPFPATRAPATSSCPRNWQSRCSLSACSPRPSGARSACSSRAAGRTMPSTARSRTSCSSAASSARTP